MLETETKATVTSFKDRQRLLREEAILDEVQSLLGSKGYSEMTVDDVIQRVGISKPTLYLHFRSKDEMVWSVVARAMRRGNEYCKSLDPSLPSADRIKKVVIWMAECRFGKDGLRFGEEGLKAAMPSPACQLKESEEAWMIDFLVQLFTAGQGEGVVRKDLVPLLIARMLVSFLRDVYYEQVVDSGELSIDLIAENWTRLALVEGAYERIS